MTQVTLKAPPGVGSISTPYDSGVVGADGFVIVDARSVPSLLEGGFIFSPSNNSPNLYNFAPSSAPWTRAGLAKLRTGSRMVINAVGDSTTAGVGGGTDPGSTGLVAAAAAAYPVRLAQILTAYGVVANSDSMWGTKAISPYATYDTRVTLGTGWATTGPNSIGASTFVGTAGQTGKLSFVTGHTNDTIVVYWLRGGSQSIPAVDIGGAVLTLTSTTGSNPGVNATTYSVTRGVNTVNLTPGASGSGTFVVGVETYDSTSPNISVRNMGWSGATSANWNDATTYYSPLNALALERRA